MALTRTQIESAKPTGKRYRLTDGGGLVLSVEPTGKKVWRFRYQRDGKDAVTTLGEYPVLTLLDARAKALALKQSGDDPALQMRREAESRRTVAAETFEALANAYIAREWPHWSETHRDRFKNRMTIDVIPVLGQMHPRDIKPVDVTRAVAGIEGRGAQNTANRVVGMIGQVLRYGVAKGLADIDVTQHLKGGLDRPAPVQHMAAVTDRGELGALLRDIWDWPESTLGKPVLQLATYLFQRPGAIQSMRWADVDLEAGVWAYHVTKVKVDHIVPLPRQAVDILRDLQRLAGRYEHVFYSRDSSVGYVSPQVPIKLLAKIGWRDRQTVHGFRAVARTVIAEDLKVDPVFIERQLSHTVPGAMGRTYNRSIHIDERRDMMQRYADHLDALRRQAK